MFPDLRIAARRPGAVGRMAAALCAVRGVIHGLGRAGAGAASDLPVLELLILPGLGLFLLLAA